MSARPTPKVAKKPLHVASKPVLIGVGAVGVIGLSYLLHWRFRKRVADGVSDAPARAGSAGAGAGAGGGASSEDEDEPDLFFDSPVPSGEDLVLPSHVHSRLESYVRDRAPSVLTVYRADGYVGSAVVLTSLSGGFPLVKSLGWKSALVVLTAAHVIPSSKHAQSSAFVGNFGRSHIGPFDSAVACYPPSLRMDSTTDESDPTADVALVFLPSDALFGKATFFDINSWAGDMDIIEQALGSTDIPKLLLCRQNDGQTIQAFRPESAPKSDGLAWFKSTTSVGDLPRPGVSGSPLVGYVETRGTVLTLGYLVSGFPPADSTVCVRFVSGTISYKILRSLLRETNPEGEWRGAILEGAEEVPFYWENFNQRQRTKWMTAWRIWHCPRIATHNTGSHLALELLPRTDALDHPSWFPGSEVPLGVEPEWLASLFGAIKDLWPSAKLVIKGSRVMGFRFVIDDGSKQANRRLNAKKCAVFDPDAADLDVGIALYDSDHLHAFEVALQGLEDERRQPLRPGRPVSSKNLVFVLLSCRLSTDCLQECLGSSSAPEEVNFMVKSETEAFWWGTSKGDALVISRESDSGLLYSKYWGDWSWASKTRADYSATYRNDVSTCLKHIRNGTVNPEFAEDKFPLVLQVSQERGRGRGRGGR